MKRIVLDAFGGDNAPLCVIEGAVQAKKELPVEIILCGNEKVIRDTAAAHGLSLEGIAIHHTDDVIDMHDDPREILKSHKNCSMAEGLRLVAAGEGDAFVSAGSTGALTLGGTFLAGRIRGIKRAAIATAVPTPTGSYLLLDSGANAECRPEMLYSFGVIGSLYAQRVMGIDAPRVGLLNIGTEDTKGDTLRLDTYKLLKDSELNFVGNIEGRDVPAGACDVLVADGFTGNVALKMTEGVSMALMGMIKKAMLSSFRSKMGALLVKPALRGLKGKTDYAEQGGAPLLGLKYPVIKAHGGSNARAIKNAVRQAERFASSGAIEAMTAAFSAKNKEEDGE